MPSFRRNQRFNLATCLVSNSHTSLDTILQASIRLTSPMYPSTPSTASSYNPYSAPLSSSYPAHPNAQHTHSQAIPITRSRTLFYLSVRDSAGPSTWDRPTSSRPRIGGRRGSRKPNEEYGARNDVDDEEERLIGGNGEEEGFGAGRKGKGKATLPPRW